MRPSTVRSASSLRKGLSSTLLPEMLSKKMGSFGSHLG